MNRRSQGSGTFSYTSREVVRIVRSGATCCPTSRPPAFELAIAKEMCWRVRALRRQLPTVRCLCRLHYTMKAIFSEASLRLNVGLKFPAFHENLPES